MPHVVVIGGGITGLVAAYRLSRQPGMDVTLLEAREELGGKIDTVALDGVPVELGPDSFLPRDEGPLRLCAELGIGGELVEPNDFGGWVFRGGRLTKLPPGTVLGFPASPRALATTPILSPAGRARAAVEILNRRRLSGPDVSVGSFTRARFGDELLERLVDPLLAGTRAGDVEEMSLAAAIPPVDAAARAHRSVTFGLGRNRSGGHARPRFFAPRGGMYRLIEALEAAIPSVDVRRGHPVASIGSAGGGFVVSARDETVHADGVIVTAPAHVAGPMLRSLSAAAADELSGIGHASSAVVNLLFPPGAVELPAEGTGILIPSSERMTISGCTWFSRKWPHLAAEDGRMTVRCFVGRGPREPALDLSDRDLTGVVAQELATILLVGAEPLISKTTRWEAGLPRYTVGHLDRVKRIEEELSGLPRLRLAGASLRGSGIPDCIAQAERACAGLVAVLRG